MNRRPAAMTLVELMLALTIFAILSTAILFLLEGAARTNSALNASLTTEQEVESALLRIVQETRLCTSLNVPSGTTPGPSFSLITQPDPANAGATYNITYTLATVNGARQLQETDPRYGTSTLVHNVQAFSVCLKNTGNPTVVILTLTAGKNPASTRTIRILARNI